MKITASDIKDFREDVKDYYTEYKNIHTNNLLRVALDTIDVFKEDSFLDLEKAKWYIERGIELAKDNLIENLEKAKWYIEREIERVKNSDIPYDKFGTNPDDAKAYSATTTNITNITKEHTK